MTTMTENPQDNLRQRIVSEIEAFAGEYGHAMTKDGVTREVVIVEQLLDFLKE